MPDALFLRDGDRYQPTSLTQGPWSPDAQHGGPPAALLSGAIDKYPSQEAMVLARVTIELLRPVPLQPLHLTTELVRPGRKVQLVAAKLSHDGQDVASALGLRIRRGDADLSTFSTEEDEIPGPEAGRPARFFTSPGAFATEAVEIRMLEGDFSEPGPGRAWIRLNVPLIEDEETTPIERVAAAADFGNGVSNLAGEARNWIFINPDLEIRMSRPPVGTWTYLDSRTRIHATGTGLASSALGDEAGWLGFAGQSLFVEAIPAEG